MGSVDRSPREGAGSSVMSEEQQEGAFSSVRDSEDEDSLGMFTPSDVDFGSEGGFGVHGVNVQMPRGARKKAKNRSRDNISCVSSKDSKTRARARKPHEPSPFLSIDNLPMEKRNSLTQGLIQENTMPVGSQDAGLNSSFVSRDARLAALIAATGPPPVNRPGSTSRPVSQVGSVASSEWNSIVPQHNRNVRPITSSKGKPATPAKNPHVRSPFKHATFNSSPPPKRPVSPGRMMREETLMATSCVARTLAKQKPQEEKKVAGRLLKGKLKPLYPVTIEGPTIEQCQGIVSEPRQDPVLSFPSNTVYRRQVALHNHLTKDAMYERPQTGESIHRTSIASDLSENRDMELKQDLDELQSETLDDYMSVDAQPVLEADPDTMVAEVGDIPASTTDGATETGEAQMNVDMSTPPTTPPGEQPMAVASSVETEPNPAPVKTPDEMLIEATTISPTPRKVGTRPKTTMNSGQRKAVRFAEETSGDITDRRAKSATARLAPKDSASQNKENKPQSRKGSGQCRPASNTGTQKKNDDDDTDQGDPGPRGTGSDHGGSGAARSGNVSRSGSAGSRPKSSQGGKGQGSGENTSQTANDSLSQSQELRLSYNSVMFAEDTSNQSNGRMRLGRPRSRLGCWEDPIRPSSTKSMSVVGHNSSQKPKVTVKVSNAKPKVVSKKTRPQSAKVVTRFSMENVRAYHRQRPASAQVKVHESYNPSIYMDSDLIIRPDASMDAAELGEKIAGHFNDNTRNKRPMSGISIAVVPTPRDSVAIAEPTYNTSPTQDISFGVIGNKMEQSLKTGVCIQCSKPTNKIAIYSDEMGVLICDVCDRQNKAKIKKIKAMAAVYRARKIGKISDYAGIDDDEGDGMELVPDEIITDDVQELDRMLNDLEDSRRLKLSQQATSSGDTGMASEETAPAASSGLFNQMDQLEQSLNAVQDEIRQCMEDVKEASQSIPLTSSEMSPETAIDVTVPCGDVLTEDTEEVLQPEVEETPATEDCGGEISRYLTEDMPMEKKSGAYQMKVYHFWQGAKKNKSSVNTAPALTKESEVSDALEDDPDITTYEVTMMQELSNEYGIITPEVAPETSETQPAPSGETSTQRGQGRISAVPGDSDQPQNDEMDPSLADLEKELGGLEIVAKAKTLNKSKVNTVQVTSKPVAPMAPLCFKVNARPPDGFLYYFAYGADMNPNRMETYIQRPVKERNWGLLFGFKLTFNKRGVDEEAGCFPNIEHNVTSSIEGCLYQITQAELTRLDSHVGYPQHYEHVMFPVWMLNCTDPNNYGVAQYCVPALMYIAHDIWTMTGEKLSNAFSVDQCIHGADVLTPSYQEQLQDLRVEDVRHSP